MIKNEIINLIKDKHARVGVIGLGYVGLPLATEFARNGFDCFGFEVDERKAAQINAGQSYIGDVDSDTVKELVEAGRLQAITDFGRLKERDAIIICVPTPLRKTKEPDVSFILAAAAEIKHNLRRGQLIILESTTYPGTTDEVLLPMFQETGLELDKDFLLAFSPERVDPGNIQRTIFPKSWVALPMIRPKPARTCIRRSLRKFTQSVPRALQKRPSFSKIRFVP